MRLKVPQFVRAGLLTAVIDGVFSSVLSRFFYGSTVTRLWQQVASVLLGPDAIDSGRRAAAIGLAMHLSVAFTWTLVFLVLLKLAPIRRAVSSNAGIVGVAAVFGPIIWMTMSLVLIPALTGRPPSITSRWWIQFFGHIPFVAMPIVATLAPHEADLHAHHHTTD
ncbi:MAG: hypothetical protein EPO35_04670 [Acidobacteria bacterium]|nr:MAG: hypothetical protein EPO35_04670 [Acidobacteriota bacterium]